MMFNWKTMFIGLLLVSLIVFGRLANHYRNNAITYKYQRNTATHNLKLANETITDMTQRQRDVAALDEKYTKELADAKAENDALRDDVAAGRRRLFVNATCPAMPTGKSTSAARVDNAASPRLATGLFHPQRASDNNAKATGRGAGLYQDAMPEVIRHPIN